MAGYVSPFMNHRTHQGLVLVRDLGGNPEQQRGKRDSVSAAAEYMILAAERLYNGRIH